ncbi:hypothetical protein CIPAW_13G070400 [Carya illinoinensis]|uniref:Uncharacterized protein n=1 Tax=Carya illinoinensis TaxID=32201 RepID=A0A8T1NMJ8_CARIL|nr:hypothetical protein CIPAW_13G070400 [Carya illinoinensis]
MESSGEDLLTAIISLMKLFSLTTIGLVVAHLKTQIISRATFKLLNKLVFALFLLCLIFTELGESITLKQNHINQVGLFLFYSKEESSEK